MPSVVAVAHGHQAIKLRLTGVYVEEASTGPDAEKICEGYLRDGAVKVLIVEERYRSEFSEYFQERLKKHKGTPLVVYCPGFEEEESNVDAYLSSVLRPAVGFEIRLE